MNFEAAVKGGILGLAVGDALGVPVEFLSRGELAQNPVTGMRGQGTHHQPAGTWSDDTSMALCLLESLTDGLDYADMMVRFLCWAGEGHLTAHGDVFDMGIATHQALARFRAGIPPLECGGRGEYDNGNGSLMRILPLALWLHRTAGPGFYRDPKAHEIIHNASALTHAHPVSLAACVLYCAAADALLCGQAGPEALGQAIAEAKQVCARMPKTAPALPAFARADPAVLLALPREEVRSGGYVVDTLEAALWCLLHAGSYRECVLEAVNLGEDTDTVAAVAGGLAGLQYGPGGIPAEWLGALAKRQEIEALCRAFAGTV